MKPPTNKILLLFSQYCPQLRFDIPYNRIKDVYLDNVENKQSVIVVFIPSDSNPFRKSRGSELRRLVFWGVDNPDNWETPAALEALKEACKELFRQIAENQHK